MLSPTAVAAMVAAPDRVELLDEGMDERWSRILCKSYNAFPLGVVFPDSVDHFAKLVGRDPALARVVCRDGGENRRVELVETDAVGARWSPPS